MRTVAHWCDAVRATKTQTAADVSPVVLSATIYLLFDSSSFSSNFLQLFALHNLPPVFGALMITKPILPACCCLLTFHTSILYTLLHRYSWKLLGFFCVFRVIRHWRYGISEWNVRFGERIAVFPRFRDPYVIPSKTTNLVWYFWFLWPCIMNARWRERNQQDATNLMFIVKRISQHVSGIIMPIFRMDILMAETCSDRRLTINIRLVASCWFLSLHPAKLICSITYWQYSPLENWQTWHFSKQYKFSWRIRDQLDVTNY